MTLRWLCALALILATGYSSAELKTTIATIDALLAQGKTVAILFIDMQTGFSKRFWAPEAYRVITAQAELLDHFSGKKGIHFIDVNYLEEGQTLTFLHQKLLRNNYYRLLVKDEDSAFEQRESLPVDGPGASAKEINTSLKNHLHSIKAEDVVTTGCFDGGCLMQTAEDALEAGFNVYVDRNLNIIDDMFDKNIPSESERRGIGIAWDTLKENYPDTLTVIPPDSPAPCG